MTTAFADFQNDALLDGRGGGATESAGTKAAAHEEAAHEKRNWVRLSYDCNNHCTFCLDSHAHDGTMRANLDIKVQILEGKKRGAERLILSGGEPTMHPNFLDFVRLGKRAGYRKVQTVTNGRMFNYPAFLETARQNGLDEITFSLHGHTAKLHDALVGTPGAFAEETGGLKAALASDAFIVNVDIVINKQNVKHLPVMLETFIGWGVREFDLLHVIPFGNAWSDAREHLFYDLPENLPYLQQAFAYARRPDVHVWLNRFPPPYTEGFEDLIQDPYKLNDEVRGRREEYDRYLAFGKKLDCREPDRCKVCYLQSLCDGLDDAIDTRRSESVERIRHVARADTAPTHLPVAQRALIVAADVVAALRVAAGVQPTELELELADWSGLAAALGEAGLFAGKRLVRCHVATSEAMSELLAIEHAFEVCVALSRATVEAVQALGAPPPRLALAQKNHDRVSAAKASDIDLRAFFAAYPHTLPVDNVPPCIAGARARPAPVTLDLAMLAPDGRVDMPSYTQRFVADGYYTKPVRCAGCSADDRCRGVHVNWVRAHGFGPLAPLTVGDEAPTSPVPRGGEPGTPPAAIT